MRVDPLTSAKRDFARSAAYRREQERFFKDVERRQEDRIAERVDDDLSDLASVAVLASESEITEFRAELDLYRTATTEALIENERQLAEVQERLDAMLARAYVLPDGRRVFKTKDGLRVFDEHGAELGREIIDPDLIEDWRPPADGYLVDHEDKLVLLRKHQGLSAFEERIETADERAKSGEMTQDELTEFRGELEEVMPLSARRNLAGYEEPAVRDATRDFGAAAADLSATDLKFDLPGLGR